MCQTFTMGTEYMHKKFFCTIQALPCNLDHIEATPVLKEDHTRGVLVNRFDILYEAFDNKVASGNENL